MHHVAVSERDADQVADLHLPEAQRHVLAVELAAGLDDPRALADAAVSDDAWGQVGLGEDFFDNRLHLFNIHGSLHLSCSLS